MNSGHWLGYAILAATVTLSSLPVACGGAAGAKLGAAGATDGGEVETADGGPLESGSQPNDAGAGSSCGALSSACQTSSECCSGLCLGDMCVASIGACAGPGASCQVGTDCCTGACVNGTCSAAQCVSVGAACPAGGNECCTSTCVTGKCAPIGSGGDAGSSTGSTCTTAGNACAAGSDCCSGLCSNGTCNIASSYCTQTNDICYRSDDCCSGICNSPNASPVSSTNPGTCALPPSSGGVNCSGVDGTLCDPTQIGCAGGCCSHLCAPFGPTGVAICQQAQGCHVEGDLCRVNADCCGGESADAGILGAGLVVCSTSVNGGTLGVCTTPTGANGGGNTCVPEGDVCHYNGAGYACSSSSARADCCGSQSPKFTACRLDKLGVPRCLAYGLDDAGADTCRPAGDTCATAADCCNGQPCVPNGQGQLTCATAACIPTSGACTSSADCCAGITCVIAPGAEEGTCAAFSPPPAGDAGSTTGSSDAGSSGNPGGGLGCASFGQSCASLGCCSGLACTNGSCVLPPK